MDNINDNQLVDSKITSRYTIVLAAAKRARQLIDGALPLTYAPTDRAVSIAVKEMSEGRLKIQVEEDMLDGNYERMLKSQNRYKNITAVSKDDLREELKDKYVPSEYKDMDDDADRDVDFKDEYGDEDGEEEKERYIYDRDEYGDEDDD